MQAMRYQFDTNGRLLTETNELTATTTTYVYNGNTVTVSTNEGDEYTADIDSEGRLASVTTRQGEISLSWQGDTKRLASTTLYGLTRTFDYNDSRFPDALTDITNSNGIRDVE